MGASQPFQSNNNRKALPSVETTIGACPEPSCDTDGADFPFGANAPVMTTPEQDYDSNAAVWPEAPPARQLIPPGEYIGEILKYEIFKNYRFPGKLSLHLHIRVFIEGAEPIILTRFLNYYAKPSTSTDYYTEWVTVNGGRAPSRQDRMSPIRLLHKMVRVRVRMTDKDKDGDALVGDLRYSVIGKILEVL